MSHLSSGQAPTPAYILHKLALADSLESHISAHAIQRLGIFHRVSAVSRAGVAELLTDLLTLLEPTQDPSPPRVRPSPDELKDRVTRSLPWYQALASLCHNS